MKLPPGYTFRKLKLTDYDNQYLETLKVLTTVGEISKESFTDLFEHWSSLPSIYFPHVITNTEGTVVATGMLFIEQKLIHECGLVGHIEDISVAKTEQCSPENVGFYEKCGYKNGGVEMVCRF
ncbi:Glucosamine 6-phosphate N-acetyltransferase [Candida maltosa Xu316]|uniref:Glucosamine 6-phosphate N-acetyltransferase n=1 Tax=Candida maltosa (strain Xu316) TaxID=1245528 RepID=M3HTV0_CANMX|nr:Glucosamine 6-phosphate N-acetyltransferase [Candida maltosa Xu316]